MVYNKERTAARRQNQAARR